MQDEAEETQELTLDGLMLYPDSRTLKWFNITNYAILYLITKPEGIVLDENDKNSQWICYGGGSCTGAIDMAALSTADF